MTELEKTVEPTWPKLVEPLEKIVDGLQVVWGMVNHLKTVKDCPELRLAIEEVQVFHFCPLKSMKFLFMDSYSFVFYRCRVLLEHVSFCGFLFL